MLRRLRPLAPTTCARVNRRVRLAPETLEDRTVPAVAATLSNGVLSILGDGGANNIQVIEGPTAGRYFVNDGLVQISGSPFNGVSSIFVDTQGGTDSVNFLGSVSHAGLSGTLTLASSGDTTFQVFDHFDVAGRLTLNHSGAQSLSFTATGANVRLGSLMFTDLGSHSTINLGGGANVNGFASFNMGAGDNIVTLNRATVSGFVSLTGTGGTDVLDLQNGTLVAGNVATDAGAGANRLFVFGSTVLGNVSHTTAGTNDTVEFRGADLKGAVNVRASAASTNLTVNAATGTTVFGALSVTTGAGNETISVSGATLRSHLNLNLGAGSGSLVLAGATINGCVVHKATGNLDVTMQSGSRIDLYASFNTSGAARTNLTVGGNSIIAKFVSIASGAGNDTINFNTATIGANFAASLGAGTDSVQLSGVDVAGGVSLTGSGTETLSLVSGTTVGTTLTVSTTAASARTTVNVESGARVSGAGTIATGAGDDVIQVTNASVLGLLTVKTGGGALNTVTLDNSRAGGLFHQGSATTERLTIQRGSRLDQYASLNTSGASAIEATFDGATVGSFLSVVGGTGDDRVTLIGATIGTSAGSTAASLVLGAGKSDVSISTSRLNGAVNLSAAGTDHNVLLASSLIDGDMALDLSTATGNVSVSIIGSDLGKELTVQAGGGADLFKLVGSSVGGAATLQSGGGSDTFTLEGTRFYDSLSLAAGAGAATLNIEYGLPPNQTSTIVRGAFEFIGGDDDDLVYLGAGDDDLAAFFGTVTLDGGAGTNFLDQAFARFYGSSPSITNF